MYTEDKQFSNSYRLTYLEGIEALVASRRQELAQKREAHCKEMRKDPDAYRREYFEMLGWPLTESRPTTPPSVRIIPVTVDSGIEIVRYQIEVLPDLWLYGILFRHENSGALPFVLSQHGGLGTPERCSDLYEDGSSNYHGMTRRVLKEGVNAFAPQLLLWDPKIYQVRPDAENTDSMRHTLDKQLKQVGGSIAALEIYALMRALDYFEAQPFVRADAIGMVGMSYGGFYTLYTAAADTRIKAALSGCFLSERDVVDWQDYVFKNSSSLFYDAEVATLIYPRDITFTLGKDDHIFSIDGAKREYARLLRLLPEGAKERVHFFEHEGKHDFCPIDEPLISFVKKLK